MEYDKDFLKKQLALQKINATDEDIAYVQRVLGIIQRGEELLEDFPEIEEEDVILAVDKEELAND